MLSTRVSPASHPCAHATFLVLVISLSLLAAPVSAQQGRNLTLLANMNLHPVPRSSVSYGYQGCAPYIHSDGREYAAVMTGDGASIVRLTDPAHPVEVGFFPAKQIGYYKTLAPFTEARQYGHYIYMTTNSNPKGFVDMSNNTGLGIIDMSNPDQPHKVANLQSPIANAHSLEIDQARGLLYTNGEFLCPDPLGPCTESMKIFSLANPESPQLLATYPTYVHHIHVKGTLGYASLLFEGGATPGSGFCAVLDLSDPSNPREITRILTNRLDQHSTWTSEDGRTLYMCNEVARDGLTAWDVSSPSSPQQRFTFEDQPTHVIHQPRVLGNRLFLSYYTAGVRVMDIRNPGWPVEFAYFDTYPSIDREGDTEGAYDVQPFFPSGIVIATDSRTGLYVFRVDPVNYGIVRGTVRDGVDGPVIAGATVTIQPAGLTVKSGRDGRFAFAVPPGASTVTVSTYSFAVTPRNVSVALNSDQTVTIAMERLPAGTLSGTVRAVAGGATLPGAEVEILGTPQRAVADAQGVYTFPSVPEGTYTVRAARPGFAAQSGSVTVPKKKTTTFNLSLGGVLFYDDAETDRGWTLRDPVDFAVGGFWARTVPEPKFLCAQNPELIQTGEDHTPNPGNTCFVTDNFKVDCATIFGAVAGIVTLTSPVLHLGGVPDPRIGYWRWFQSSLPGVSTTPALFVKLSNDGGATWVTAETYRTLESAWRFAEVRVGDFFPSPGDVLLRIVVDNAAFAQFRPEAAIDDIATYSGGGGSSSLAAAAMRNAGAPAFTIGAPRPSPTRGEADIDFTLGRAARVRSDIFDLQGRLVRTAIDRELPAGHHAIHWNGRTSSGQPAASGIYWVVVRAGAEERKIRLVVTR